MVARFPPLPDQGAAGPVSRDASPSPARAGSSALSIGSSSTSDRCCARTPSPSPSSTQDQRPCPRGGVVGALELRELLAAAGAPSLAEAVLARDRPLLLPAVEAWEAAPDLRAGAAAELGGGRADRAWALFGRRLAGRRPVRGETGRALGVLTVVSLDRGHAARRRRACARSRCSPTSPRWRSSAPSCSTPRPARARAELQLKRAAEAISASLDPDEVHREVARCRRRADRRQQGARSRACTRARASCGWRRTSASPTRSPRRGCRSTAARSARSRARACRR